MSVTVTLTRLAGHGGQPVLLLGPSLGTCVERLWRETVAELDGLEVLGWDLPGHGFSPAADGPFTLEELAADVLLQADRITGSDGSTQYLYAGDSVGGAVGLELALAHAERLASLVVVCSAARFGTAPAWADRAAMVRSHGMRSLLADTPGRWFGSMVRASPTAGSRGALADIVSIDAASYARTCEAISTWDVTDRLHCITTPLLAIAGADDAVTPVAMHQDLARAVTNGRFAVLRGVGHLAPLEDPAGTAALLRDHFQSTGLQV